ncbi:Hpt domain-containing protein [Rhodoferax sp.]|uniref:Hpt domain-containing protein n=1 Tax=Rhodoferax sp. TaxID=50421 RepID=UPI0025DB21D8|nr:Hpt domain-containing protein [Rhodoferax sp.]
MADAFLAQWPKDKLKLASYLAAGDFDGLLHTAHGLKATMGLLEAQPVSALAQRLESVAAFADATAADGLIALLAREVDLLAEALQQRSVGFSGQI